MVNTIKTSQFKFDWMGFASGRMDTVILISVIQVCNSEFSVDYNSVMVG